jgi:hypothetical protein
MRSESCVNRSSLPGLRIEARGSRCISNAKIADASSVDCSASLRERSGWLWELFSI